LGCQLKPEVVQQYCEKLNKGLLSKDTDYHIVRFVPPFFIKDEIDFVLEKITEVLN